MVDNQGFGLALKRLWPHGDITVPGLVAGIIASAPTVFAKCPLASTTSTVQQQINLNSSDLGSGHLDHGCQGRRSRSSDHLVDPDRIRRDLTTTAPNTASNRTAADLIAIEVNRQIMRSAQATLGSYNANFRPGANLDLIDWRLRAYCDGCHFGELGMVAHAQALVAAL